MRRRKVNGEELKQRLVEEGCSTINYSIGYRDSDVYCLLNENGTWRVFYTERGQDDDLIFEGMSEEEACEFFFNYITKKFRHDHLVAGMIRAIASALWGRIFSRCERFLAKCQLRINRISAFPPNQSVIF